MKPPKITEVKVFNSSHCQTCGKFFKHNLEGIQKFCNDKCANRYIELEEQWKKEEEERIKKWGDEAPPVSTTWKKNWKSF